jgi:foldase protein PrsA
VLAIVAVAGFMAACGGLPGSAVAKVGDVYYIDSAKFTAQVDDYAAQYSVNKETDPESYKALAASVLDSLVSTELAVQKAPSLDISVTAAEIQSKVDAIVTDYYSGDQSALVTDLATQSMTMDDLKKQVADYLLSGLVHDQVVKDVAAPTEAEMAAYYEANKASFLTEQSVDARHILVPVDGKVVQSSAATTTTTAASTTETTGTTATSASTTTTTLSDLAWAKALATAAQVRAELLAGGSWSRLAAKFSGDKDTKNSGGSLGTLLQGALVDTLGQEFDTTLFSLELNQISEPVKTANGYEIIQVTKVTEPQQKTLAESKADIEAILLTEAQDKAWLAFLDKVKLEIRVVYREDMRPTTTTTTTAGETTTTVKP